MTVPAQKSDLPRTYLEDHFRATFGEVLAKQIMDVQAAYLKNEWEPYKACADCGEAPFMFMLRDELWDKIAPRVSADGTTWSTGFLCIWCCETRLERRLTIDDFAPVRVNASIFFAMVHDRLVFE